MFLKPKKKWTIKRTANYTEVEYISLVMASESVTLDVVTGNDQTDKKYWQCIEEMFCPFMSKPSPRSLRSLQVRCNVSNNHIALEWLFGASVECSSKWLHH